MFHIGVIENREDPLRLGRCKVRVVGIHTHDKSVLPTNDLPWAVQSIPNSAAMNGIGISPTNFVEGTVVLVVFLDAHKQSPVIMGGLVGIPQTNSKLIDTLSEEYSANLDAGDIDTKSTDPVSDSPDEIDPDAIVTSADGAGCAALNKAMDDAGITSKYARASILGICKVESDFKLVAENLNYSYKGLLSTFPSVFKNDVGLAKSIEKKPRNIGEVVYGPVYGKGKELGNDVIGDGYKYRGRGYVQLTGKANYAKYSDVAGVDLVADPDAMLDEDIASKVTVQYFKDRVKTSEDSPSYIQSALKAVGLNRSDIKEKKINAYEYYLGEVPPVDQTDKTTDISKSQNQHAGTTRINGVPIDRASSQNYGFEDPNFKYPLKSYIGEPDTNRLARGRFTGTIVDRKDKNRLKGVPTSIGSSWSQPIDPYNAVYPYNHVMETESGHVQEFDDTPGNERIRTYHRKGTFEEIDRNGTKVTRIVGDNYEIIDRNGYLYIAGNINATVAGNINILGQTNANIKIHGTANINVHGDANVNVAGNMNTNVGGSWKVKANDVKIETNTFDITAVTMKVSVDNYGINADEYYETVGDSYYRYEGDKHIWIGADTYNRHDSGTDHSCPADPSREVSVDCEDIDSAEDAASTSLGTAIGQLNRVSPSFPTLQIPPRNADVEFIFETPEEIATGTPPKIDDAMPETQAAETVQPRRNRQQIVPPSCDFLYSMEEFPKSLVLHVDSTGYSWTLGKCLNNNTLKEITIKGKRYSKADIVCNLKGLCENILGKLNEKIGTVDKAWSISSIYRNFIPDGGVATSQHLTGQAVDIVIGGNYNYDTMYDWAKELAATLPYDQFLYEFLDTSTGRKNWLHISYSPTGGRKQILTFLNHSTNAHGLKKLA